MPPHNTLGHQKSKKFSTNLINQLIQFAPNKIINYLRQRQENTDFLLSCARKKIFYSLKNAVNFIFGKKSRNNQEILVSIRDIVEFIVQNRTLLKLFAKKFKQ